MLDLAGKRVTVMGLGRFGGGIGVCRFLAAQGADVLVTDLAPADELAGSVAKIADLVGLGIVTLRLGGHKVSDFTTRDLVVANPAVPKPWDNRFLRAAAAGGVPVATEISLLLERLPSRERCVAVTGSVGKSTTTAMIHHALSATLGARGEDVLLGGNIGGSLLEQVDSITDRTWVVLELSSAMLHWLQETPGGWSPGVAVATNFAANHLDWHGTVEHYRKSKQAILAHQRPGDRAVLGTEVASWAGLTRGTAVIVDPRTLSGRLKVPGEHNRVNGAAALAACRALAPDVSEAALAEAIRGFPGLAHRLQLVAERDGMLFYNDSKSTTPESALKAIEAIATMPGCDASKIHLIAGGYDKGANLTPIAKAAPSLAGMYTIGVTGPGLAGAAGQKAHECGTLQRAVETALSRMRPGDVLLLSPGCASWDQFTNYEDRGEAFTRAVSGAGPAVPAATPEPRQSAGGGR